MGHILQDDFIRRYIDEGVQVISTGSQIPKKTKGYNTTIGINRHSQTPAQTGLPVFRPQKVKARAKRLLQKAVDRSE